MSFYERLCSIISEKGLTVRKVERECGLANASIRRWAEQSPRLESVVAVANYLQVSIDYLALGRRDNTTEDAQGGKLLDLDALKEEQGLTCDGIPLDDLEIDLVAMFRLLPPSHQEEVFDLVYFKYKRHVEQKKESLFSEYRAGSASEKSDPAEGGEAQGGIA